MGKNSSQDEKQKGRVLVSLALGVLVNIHFLI